MQSPMRSSHAETSGLTLIEILVALLVLSIGAFSLLSAGNQAVRLGRDAASAIDTRAASADGDALRRVFERVHPSQTTGETRAQIIQCLENSCSLVELQQLFSDSG